MRKNVSRVPAQYKVHENVDESFMPERPLREGDEYVVERGRIPETYFLPPSQQPLTLQTVMRPNNMGKPGPRPPFRRPLPPEIKLRRPGPPYPQKNNGYPLPMPGPHPPYGMQKKPSQMKYNGRLPPGPIRHLPPSMPPMKSMPPLLHQKIIPPNQKFTHKQPESTVQSLVIGKPTHGGPSQAQTLNLGKTDIIMNQVVRSQITLPGAADVVAQHSSPQTFVSRPGQIILGKPMENPQPLDQQMTHTKHHTILTPPSQTSVSQAPTRNTQSDSDRNTAQNEIKSSDFMGESVETSTLQAAVNTGFKPDSIVIESGFKPIIREPLMAAEDRIADDGEKSGSNRREDTDVEEDYEEAPQYINHVYPSDKLTESFEPMFIPSPPDHLVATEERTREVFPSNHAKEDRPHPVYVKTEQELNALFSKKNMEKEVPSDMVMESNKVSPQYLPPDPKLPKEQSQKLKNEETFTTYDGKTVSAATLTSIPDVKSNTKLYSSKLPANTELLLKTPQFGPFKGEIPPLLGVQLNSESDKDLTPHLTDSRTTHLKLVNAFHEPDELNKDDLKAEASETHEEGVEEEEEANTDEDLSDDEYEEEETENTRKRRDTKITQFEKGEVVEQIPIQSSSAPKSQMDFDGSLASSNSNRLLFSWSLCPVLLILYAKFV